MRFTVNGAESNSRKSSKRLTGRAFTESETKHTPAWFHAILRLVKRDNRGVSGVSEDDYMGLDFVGFHSRILEKITYTRATHPSRDQIGMGRTRNGGEWQGNDKRMMRGGIPGDGWIEDFTHLHITLLFFIWHALTGSGSPFFALFWFDIYVLGGFGKPSLSSCFYPRT